VISWSGDLTVDSVTPAAGGDPAQFTAVLDDPALIVESPPWLAGSVTVTVVMADGVDLPVDVGATIAAHLRVA
jgi:hypothetical protein